MLSLATVPNPAPPLAPRLGVAPAEALDPADLSPTTIDALYIHVPFCFHKCHYCDFYSITRQTPQRMQRFVELLLREADFWIARFRGPPIEPRTVFFGGGTPTLLPL